MGVCVVRHASRRAPRLPPKSIGPIGVATVGAVRRVAVRGVTEIVRSHIGSGWTKRDGSACRYVVQWFSDFIKGGGVKRGWLVRERARDRGGKTAAHHKKCRDGKRGTWCYIHSTVCMYHV